MLLQSIFPSQERTDLVTFNLKINRAPIGHFYQVQSISTHKEINKIPWAKITLLDGRADEQDFSASNESVFVPGNEIEILAGYHNEEETVFKGKIIKQCIKIRKNRPAVLEVICKDESLKLTIGRKNKYFYNKTDNDIIGDILREQGISNSISPGLTDLQHPEIVQYYVTDWDFIVNRADINGKLVFVDDGTVTISAPELNTLPSIGYQFGVNIWEFEGELDATCQYKSVKASSWSFADQNLVESESEDPFVLSEQGNLSSSDLADVVGLDHFQLQHSGEVSDQELQNWANAQRQRSFLAKIRGRIKVQGIASVKPGQLVQIGGIGDRFNGPAFVSSVRQSIANGNWFTDIGIGLSPKWFAEENGINSQPASNLIPGVCGLQVGVVKQLKDDPDQQYRVLVKLPMVDNNDDGTWARVSTLDAGDSRGSFFRPEIGDEVIVGFINDDPRDAILLGMLNSNSQKAAPLEATDENHQKGFVTRSGMKMIWDDDKISLTIDTPAGNILEISEDKKSISITDQNNNEIQLNENGIVIKAAGDLSLQASGDVNIEGTNVKAKATAEFSAEGSAGAKLTSSGTTDIKGSLVNIN